MRRYRGSTGEERRVERREALIDAAIQVYGDIGYANASVRRVVQAAGLTERYFYESFKNSDDLLDAAFQHIVTRLYADVDQAAPPADGRGLALVETKMRAYYEALRDHPAEARVFLVEMPGKGAMIDQMFGVAMDRFAILLASYLPAGAVASGDRYLLRGIMGGMMQIARLWIAEDYCAPVEEVAAAASRLCAALIPVGTEATA